MVHGKTQKLTIFLNWVPVAKRVFQGSLGDDLDGPNDVPSYPNDSKITILGSSVRSLGGLHPDGMSPRAVPSGPQNLIFFRVVSKVIRGVASGRHVSAGSPQRPLESHIL